MSAARRPLPDAPTVPELLALRARIEPDATAIALDGGGTLALGAWHARAERLAIALADRGVGRGEAIGLLFGNDEYLDYAVAYAAVLRAGAVAVPLSARLPAAELARVARTAGIAGLIHGSAPAPPLPCWTATATALAAGAREGAAPPPPAREDPAEILHTSGTTGTAAGVLATHANLAAEGPPDWDEEPRTVRRLHALPLGTNMGQVALRVCLVSRALTVVLPRFEPARFQALIVEHEIDEIVLVPTMARLLLEAEPPAGAALDRVSEVWLSAAPAYPALLARLAERFPRARLRSSFTSTEAWPAGTVMEYRRDRPDSAGRPVDGCAVLIVDAAGRPLPPGAHGHVVLAAAHVPRRRYADGRASATFGAAGVRTGDVGYLDADGLLVLVDRSADAVDVAGHAVSTLDVERAALECDGVRDAAAFGVPDELLGERVALAVVLAEGTSVAGVRAQLAEQLADHRLPRDVFALDELPRTELGKPLKRELRARFAAGGEAADEGAAALAVADVVAIWREVLGHEQVGADDDFLAAGGSSIAAFAIVARLRSRSGLPVPASLVFAAPTPAAQAEALAAFAARPRGAADGAVVAGEGPAADGSVAG